MSSPPPSPDIDPRKLRAALKRTHELRKEAEAALERTKQELEAKTLRVQMLEPVLAEVMTEKEDLLKKLNAEQEKNIGYQNEMTAMKKKLEQFGQQNSVSVISEGNEDLIAELEKLRKQVSEDEVSMTVLSDTIEGLDKEITVLRAENLSLKEKLSQETKEIKQRNEKMVEDLIKELENEESKRKDIENKFQHLTTEAENRSREFQQVLDDTRASNNAEIAKYQVVLQQMKDGLANILAETRRLRHKFFEIKDYVSMLQRPMFDSYRQRAMDCCQMLEKGAAISRMDLEKQINNAQSLAQDMSSQIQVLETEKSHLQKQISEMSTSQSTLEKEKQELSCELETLKREVDQLHETQARHSLDSAKLKDEYETEIAKMKKQLSDSGIHEQKLNETIATAKNELRTLYTKLEDQSQKFQEDLSAEQMRYEQIERQYQNQLEICDARLEDISKLNKLNDENIERKTLLESELALKENEISELNHKIQVLESRIGESEKHEETIEMLQNQIVSLKSQCDELATAVQDKSSQLRQHETSLRMLNDQLESKDSQSVNMDYVRKMFLSFCGMSKKDKDQVIPILLQLLNCDAAEVEQALQQWKSTQGFSIFM